MQEEWKEPHYSKCGEYANAVRLETLYKCCMPAIYSLDWEEEINYKTTMPLTAVVAFLQNGEQYYSIDQKFATWVQSGGTRVTPMKANLSKDKVDYILKNSSALVIPEIRNE